MLHDETSDSTGTWILLTSTGTWIFLTSTGTWIFLTSTGTWIFLTSTVFFTFFAFLATPFFVPTVFGLAPSRLCSPSTSPGCVASLVGFWIPGRLCKRLALATGRGTSEIEFLTCGAGFTRFD